MYITYISFMLNGYSHGTIFRNSCIMGKYLFKISQNYKIEKQRSYLVSKMSVNVKD